VITKLQLINTGAPADAAIGLTWGMRRAHLFAQSPTNIHSLVTNLPGLGSSGANQQAYLARCSRACPGSRKKSTAVADQIVAVERNRAPRLLLIIMLAVVLSVPALAQTITIKADPNNPGAVIPADFIGFSGEVEDFVGGIYSGSNASLIGILQLLGPNGVMRIGGGTEADVPPDPLTPQIASNAAGFLSALGPGWSLLYGLDNAVNDSSLAVQQAGYLLNAFPRGQVAFQAANEPDLFYDGNEQLWLSVFNDYSSAIIAAYGSGVNFGAPDATGFHDLSWPCDTILGCGGFQYLTTHKYSLGCNPLSSWPSVATVLNDAAAIPYIPGLSVTEWGIICDGGMQGITDRLIAATYYLRFAMSAVVNGYAGIMPHNVVIPELWGDGKTRPAYYNQFIVQPDGGYAPTPMFYGMYLFARIVGQQTIPVSTGADYSRVASIIATLSPNSNANILVANINPRRGFYVKPDQTRPWSSANVFVLSGINCADPAPVLNGYPIGEGGSWGGSVATLNQGQSVFVPSCGATLIEIQAD
jgi:hypothetical protein